MSTTEEQILVIPAETLAKIAPFEGFTRDIEKYLGAVLESQALEFRPRSQMETDPSFKQLIPYVILRHTDSEGEIRLFTYTRGRGQGEARLHARRSIGIGGHISVEDAQTIAGQPDAGPYRNGMLRELTEEVRLLSTYREQCVGMIYDPSTEVGRVHIGVVHLFDLDQPQVEPNEDDICETEFLTIDQLQEDFQRLEVWSQLAMKELFGK
jgi:predicted NUDIX family phosphoesterase